jgi:hypothetical protein
VLSHDQCFDRVGIHIEVACQVVAKAQAVQEGSGAFDLVEAERSDQVGKRFGRIRNDQVATAFAPPRTCGSMSRYTSTFLSRSEACPRIGPIGRAAGFLVPRR